MTEKVCRICASVLPLDLFVKDKKGKDGRATRCKACAADSVRKYYEANPSLKKTSDAKWREKNKDKILLYQAKRRKDREEQLRAYFKARYAKFREANPPRIKLTENEARARHLERQRLYRAKNKDKIKDSEKKRRQSLENKIYAASKCREYQAKKRNAVPPWAKSEFDRLVLSEAYDLAKKREVVTGIKWHVDHIVPLQGRLVCGLHCANNIAVIPAADNIRKGSRAWPDMP